MGLALPTALSARSRLRRARFYGLVPTFALAACAVAYLAHQGGATTAAARPPSYAVINAKKFSAETVSSKYFELDVSAWKVEYKVPSLETKDGATTTYAPLYHYAGAYKGIDRFVAVGDDETHTYLAHTDSSGYVAANLGTYTWSGPVGTATYLFKWATQDLYFLDSWIQFTRDDAACAAAGIDPATVGPLNVVIHKASFLETGLYGVASGSTERMELDEIDRVVNQTAGTVQVTASPIAVGTNDTALFKNDSVTDYLITWSAENTHNLAGVIIPYRNISVLVENSGYDLTGPYFGTDEKVTAIRIYETVGNAGSGVTAPHRASSMFDTYHLE